MDNLENIDVSNMDVSTMSKVIERLWPKFLDAGMNIVWAVLILIVGLKLISILRKFLKKTLLRGNVDTGVVQFLDALVKISAWTVSYTHLDVYKRQPLQSMWAELWKGLRP